MAKSGENDYLLELASEGDVLAVQPDFGLLGQISARGVMVTARAADERSADFVSRFFAPAVGVDEDPVTGSAHCALAPFWCRRFQQDRAIGYQASRRGGTVRVEVRGDRVLLEGQAVTVLEGALTA